MNVDIQCEFQLMNWGESATTGAWVKFWVSPEDLDAFRAIRCRSGKSAGQRFMGALVEIGDDEQPVAPQKAENVPGNTTASHEADKPAGGPLARLAGMLCTNPAFQSWMCAENANDAAELVRDICGVQSRAELDHNPVASDLFHRRIRLPWREHCGVAA